MRFDINGDGRLDQISWTALGSDDAWLALDRNGNGQIDDGKGLFGNATPLANGTYADRGFQALAEYDQPLHGGNETDSLTLGMPSTVLAVVAGF